MVSRENIFGYLPYAAGLLTLLSLVFNVGFFSGVGSGFFTLFSIQDHILFSFQAIPLVVLLSMAIMIMIFGVCVRNFGLNKDYEDFYEYILGLDRVAIYYPALIALFFILVVTAAVTGIFVLHALGTLILMISTAGMLTYWQQTRRSFSKETFERFINLIILVSFIQIIFTFGVLIGSIDRGPESFKYKISPGDSEYLSIIRSGQAGLLVSRRDGTILYLRRDDVKQIERGRS